MENKRAERIRRLEASLEALTEAQFFWIQRIIQQFGIEPTYQLLRDDFLNQSMLDYLGTSLRIHHCFSEEPFSKDKFEHVLRVAARAGGKPAELAPKGNPGHDITIDNERFSLKTQANKGLKLDELHISKFMELGRGDWVLEKLRNQFFAHMQSYERILVLRALSKAPQDWLYELVEIPKSLLEQAREGTLEIMEKSPQTPKPGYCWVYDDAIDQPQLIKVGARAGHRPVKFALYFDGGTERKLQVRYIKKKYCFVHTTWRFPAVSLEDIV